MVEIKIIKRMRRGSRWALRVRTGDVTVLTPRGDVELIQPLRAWMESNCTDWQWKLVQARALGGPWRWTDWSQHRVRSGERLDIIFPDRETMIAFAMRWGSCS